MGIDTSNGHPDMDYAEHEKTYHGFVKGFFWSIGIIVAIVALMGLFLTP